MHRLLIRLAALSILAAGVPAGAEPLEGSGQSPGAAAFESFLLPGLGQFGNGSWLKGGLFLGAYAGFVAWGVSVNQDVQDAKGHRNAAPSDELSYWNLEVDRLESSRNAKFGLAAFVLVLSVAEAYVDAHLKGFDRRIDADVGWVPLGGEPGFGLVLTAVPGEPRAGRSAR